MTARYDDMTAAINQVMQTIGTRMSAALWGVTRDNWGKREAHSLGLYARDYGRLTPGELESALLGHDLTWEYLDDGEAPCGTTTR